MSAELPVIAATCSDPKDFKSELKPIWCPGCGDFGVLQALYRALAAIGRPPHEIAFISGIGCSSRIPGYTTAYGFNTVHGRALPIAQGIKLANPDLLVLGAGGDGDGFSIGGGHLPHAIRRNIDITYIVMDNQIYGLTKGQLSPTSKPDLRTVTSPHGALEAPVNPLLYTLAYGAGFVAQSTPADMAGLAQVIEEAIRYPGFSFVNVQSPCVTFGEDDWQVKQHRAAMKSLASLNHDATDLLSAMDKARTYGAELYTGVFYKNPSPAPSGPVRPPLPASSTRSSRSEQDLMTTTTRGIDFTKLSLKDALDLASLVEEEAEERYLELVHQMEIHRTEEAAAFFKFMAGNEKKHGMELSARRKKLFGDAARTVTRAMLFDIEAPDYDEARAFMSPKAALEVAMRSEQKAFAFFESALPHLQDAEVKALFLELRDEEIHHQDLIKKELAKLPEGEGLPLDAFVDDPIQQ